MSTPEPRATLTALNVMASWDFETATRTFARWGLRWIDLWGSIYGDSVETLSADSSRRAVDAMAAAGLRPYCLSSRVFDDHVEQGEASFRAKHLGDLDRVLDAARILEPRFVRIIAGRLADAGPDPVGRLRAEYPWVADVYREAIDRILQAGFTPTMENEADACFLVKPTDFLDFLDWVQPPPEFRLTWDIQNAWKLGSYPTLEGFRALEPHIGYVHLKGGAAEPEAPETLRWNVGLESATWPLLEITQAVVESDVSPVICLNPSHGAYRDGYDYGAPGAYSPEVPLTQWELAPLTEREIDFLRRTVKGIA